jgi:hypothetical protein
MGAEGMMSDDVWYDKGRVKSGQKFDDVIYGCPLTTETE